MFLITFLSPGIGLATLASDDRSLSVLLNLLEKSKTPFKVSHPPGYVTQDHFRIGGFEYWMDADYRFTSTDMLDPKAKVDAT